MCPGLARVHKAHIFQTPLYGSCLCFRVSGILLVRYLVAQIAIWFVIPKYLESSSLVARLVLVIALLQVRRKLLVRKQKRSVNNV
jgi:hypothetical protein